MTVYVTHCFRPTTFLPEFTRCYTPEWADKLYRGIQRNLDRTARMVCFTDYDADEFKEPIDLFDFSEEPSWLARMETFCPDMYEHYDTGHICWLDLDTIIVGDMSDIDAYEGHWALLLDSGNSGLYGSTIVSCNLQMAKYIWDLWQETRARHKNNSEMQWMRRNLQHVDTDVWDDMAPGQMLSYKNHVTKGVSTDNARLIYFHGHPKPHEVTDDPLVREHWI